MNNIEHTKSKEKTWLDSICDRTKLSRIDVQAFIKKYNIPQSPSIGSPKRIHIVSINFSGKKQGKNTDDFDFMFDNLSPGIWGLFSDGNGKGKSTALEIIKWLFKGKVSDGLQSGVKSWIHFAEVKFRVDSLLYSISINQVSETFHGEIRRSINDKDFQPFKEFNSEEEMALVVSNFMLDQLDLGQISSFKQGGNELEEGKEIIHGWPALASAMFIGTSYGAIFGDIAMSGLPNRILNMYMGLPWIPTHSALKALDGKLQSLASIENQHLDRAQQIRQARLKEIQDELYKKEKFFEKLSPPAVTLKEYNKIIEEYNNIYKLHNDSYRRLVDSQTALLEIEKTYKADQKNLINFKEDRAANKIFKQLNPTCCPHCEQKITFQQLEKERIEHTCSICDRTMLDSDNSEMQLAELQEKSSATTQAYNELKDTSRLRKNANDELSALMYKQEATLNKYKINLDFEQNQESNYRNLQTEISTLKILEKEYSENGQSLKIPEKLNKVTTRDENQSIIDENKILKAALIETENRFRSLQVELLQGVNKKMMEFCSKVGLNQYSNLNLTSQPMLKIQKDGSETSFSKVSKGEQLRLKVLATIALISVAEEQKVGRHPGFLIIDSPAAHEVNKDDLNNLISGLEELRETLPSLQIFLASVANNTLLEHVDENHRKYAKGTDFLW